MTESRVMIRSAYKHDARTIVELIRTGFSPELVDVTIYGAPGIEAYVESQLTRPVDRYADTSWIAAVCGNEIVGCAEVRRIRGGRCLNYISVSTKHRGKRIATKLLVAILSDHVGGHETLFLDVLEDNTVAREWYERMGFQAHHVTEWRTFATQALRQVDPRRAYAVGLAQAEAVQRAYGFSHFRLVTSDREYDIGQLGDRWFRVVDAHLLSDNEAVAALAEIDPARHILGLFGRKQVSRSLARSGELRASTLRMSLDETGQAGVLMRT